MINSTLKRLVKAEAKNLKKFAKKSELKKLNFKKLQPSDGRFCVYGQMTGYCFSKRATTLIEQCCEKVCEASFGNEISDCNKLNGSPKETNRGYYWSPIEVYVCNNKAKSSNLIAYLKGERKTLVI